MSVTLPAPSASFWDIYAAAQEGFFSKYGINVTIGSTPGPAATLAAVTSGGDDIGSPFISDTIVAIAKGSPIEVIGGEGNSTVESLVGSKGLKNVSGLSGKKIVVTTPKDLPTYAIEQYLAKHGLAAGSYSLVYTESSPSRLAALKSGAVAGAQLLSPWDYEALSQGFSNLGLITSPYLQVAPVANKGWVKSHKAAAVAYLKGTMAAVQWLYNPKNKAAALQILEKATKISAGAAASGYSELIGGRVFPTNGSIPTSSFNQTISAMQTLGLLSKGKSYSLNQFFDQAPLAAANGS